MAGRTITSIARTSLAIVAALAAMGGFVVWRSSLSPSPHDLADRAAFDSSAAIDESALRALCAHCHFFPEPETLPRAAWRNVITDMAGLPGYGVNVPRPISPAAIAEWYEERAPAEYTFPATAAGLDPGPFRARVRRLSPDETLPQPVVSHVKFADLLDDPGLELLVCEMRHGRVLLGRPAAGSTTLEVLAEVPHPAHAEAVDLDGDGLCDVVVANLGSFLPLDHNLGSVEWLRQTAPGVFQRITLFDGLGRVADVQPADLDGDGDVDLIVAEFGWRATGHLLVLENVTSDWSRPEFIAHYLDGRSGAIHAPVADLDGDGRPDIVALFAQQHEAVVAYLNRGDFRFDLRELDRAPHPAWGFSGMQLADLDGDGDLDVLVTNGDTLDDGRIKPDHGINWLENRGNLEFVPHRLAVMYGVHRAEAADLDGDGDLDIVACAFTGWDHPEAAAAISPVPTAALLWLEQVAPGRFRRRNLDLGPCRHPTLTVGDFDGDGDVDFAVGNAAADESSVYSWVDVWENQLK
ncbi:MAG TPA: FG-GAP-like repeat-containing protein [Planctomycetaceae bacterium]|nr:FG-GAP-like repeat-containing protein [Planctomycetaceae bacterium]